MPLLLKAPADPTFQFPGRTILITGSNSGLGLAAAKKFAHLQAARIVLAVRDVRKGEVARQEILASLRTRNQDASPRLDVWKLDMSDYDSIKAFAARVASDLDRLDVVVLNAGTYKREYSRSKYGWEETLQVNVLSTVLLAILLLPTLRHMSAAVSDTDDRFPVMEFVSSGLHTRAKLTEDEKRGDVKLLAAFNSREAYAVHPQYCRSKLLLMYCMQELSQRSSSTSAAEAKLAADRDTESSIEESNGRVHITSVCPGPCISELARDYMTSWYGPLVRVAMQFFRLLFLRTAEEGARTYVSGIRLGEKGNGQFWQHDRIKDKTPLLAGAVGAGLQKRVWHEVVDALGRDMPEIMDKIQ